MNNPRWFYQFLAAADGTRSDVMCGTLDDIKANVGRTNIPSSEFYVLVLCHAEPLPDDDSRDLFSRLPLMLGDNFVAKVSSPTAVAGS